MKRRALLVLAAKAAGLSADVKFVERSQVEAVFIDMTRMDTAAAILFSVNMDNAEMAKLALRHRVPTMGISDEYAAQGGLMGFSMDHGNDMRHAASINDKVLWGMNPADIPWELPDRQHFAINVGTARLLGLTVPPDLLLRADQVIQ